MIGDTSSDFSSRVLAIRSTDKNCEASEEVTRLVDSIRIDNLQHGKPSASLPCCTFKQNWNLFSPTLNLIHELCFPKPELKFLKRAPAYTCL